MTQTVGFEEDISGSVFSAFTLCWIVKKVSTSICEYSTSHDSLVFTFSFFKKIITQPSSKSYLNVIQSKKARRCENDVSPDLSPTELQGRVLNEHQPIRQIRLLLEKMLGGSGHELLPKIAGKEAVNPCCCDKGKGWIFWWNSYLNFCI